MRVYKGTSHFLMDDLGVQTMGFNRIFMGFSEIELDFMDCHGILWDFTPWQRNILENHHFSEAKSTMNGPFSRANC